MLALQLTALLRRTLNIYCDAVFADKVPILICITAGKLTLTFLNKVKKSID